MDLFTLITVAVSISIVLFSIAAVVGAVYGILVWYPSYMRKRIGDRKASGRQGEAAIIRLPDHELGYDRSRRPAYVRVPIGLEIRVIGLDPYEVDKTFSIPTHALSLLEVGKVVPCGWTQRSRGIWTGL
jgi:hypothetical protein